MMKLRLANEYLAGPIFCWDSENMGHIDVEVLPISEDLKCAIRLWDEEYQATFNTDYPPDSGFLSTASEQAHQIRGNELARRLQNELGDKYSVEFKP